jgi:hypothetical protein
MNDKASADYERSDIDAAGIGWIAAGLGLFVLAVPLAMPLAFPQSLHRADPASRPAISADVPALEVAPLNNLQRFRRTEAEFSDTYGWTDRERKIARIPVSRAIERLLRTGIPGWSPP